MSLFGKKKVFLLLFKILPKLLEKGDDGLLAGGRLTCLLTQTHLASYLYLQP